MVVELHQRQILLRENPEDDPEFQLGIRRHDHRLVAFGEHLQIDEGETVPGDEGTVTRIHHLLFADLRHLDGRAPLGCGEFGQRLLCLSNGRGRWLGGVSTMLEDFLQFGDLPRDLFGLIGFAPLNQQASEQFMESDVVGHQGGDLAEKRFGLVEFAQVQVKACQLHPGTRVIFGAESNRLLQLLDGAFEIRVDLGEDGKPRLQSTDLLGWRIGGIRFGEIVEQRRRVCPVHKIGGGS